MFSFLRFLHLRAPPQQSDILAKTVKFISQASQWTKFGKKALIEVYHLNARSRYGLMVQIFAGFITYLLLAIYCHDHHNAKVSIQSVRQIRTKVQNELRGDRAENFGPNFKQREPAAMYAST
jgi:hypothetical protein